MKQSFDGDIYSDKELKYQFESYEDEKKVLDWLRNASSFKLLEIRRILLDKSSDGGNSVSKGFEMGDIPTPELLYQQCVDNGIDIVPIMKRLDNSPIIDVADNNDDDMFISSRKKKLANIDVLEKELGLK